MWSYSCFATVIGSVMTAIAGLSTICVDSSVAQVTPDNTLLNNSKVDRVDKSLNISGGTSSGANLFHSFKDFYVPTGWEAVFKNNADIQNIFTRVTGNSISQIDGLIKANGSANLFLMNPNGIVFGENASLNIGGSFIGTSAESMKFSDGSEFSATNPQAPPLLKVNITPGLQYGKSQPGATISNTGNLTSQQDLKLVADKLDLQGELKARRNLTLQAGDTVKVRDSVTTPFLAESGGNLSVQGNQGIDILALNHPNQSPFVSGGDLSLISDGIISGDARFTSNGNFSLRSISGEIANFVSKYNPIISSNGDVDVAANYTGASLLVESKGNIRFRGDINITEPNTSNLFRAKDSEYFSNSTALIMRSGQETLAYGGVNSGSVLGFASGTVPEGITIDGNVLLQPFKGVGGIVDLTAASENTSTQRITTNGGEINLKANNGSITTGILNSSSLSNSDSSRKGGNITLSAKGSINTGSLFSASFSGSDNAGNGGAINIESSDSINIADTWNSKPGNFVSGALNSSSFSANNMAKKGGGINLVASNGINITGNSYAYSLSFEGIAGDGGDIRLESKNGSITAGNLSANSSSNSGTSANGGAIALTALGNITTAGINSETFSVGNGAGNGGDITISAVNGNIATTGDLLSNSYSSDTVGAGGVITLSAGANINTQSLKSSSYSYSSDTVGAGGAITLSAGENINTQSLKSDSLTNFGTAGTGGAITLSAGANIDTQDINSYSLSFGGAAGTGGAITLNAKANINTENITSRSSAFDKTGSGGAIALNAGANINTQSLDSGSSSQSIQYEAIGGGGAITLNAGNAINFQEYNSSTKTFELNSRASINSSGGAGSGNITINSNAPFVLNNGSISSDTFGSGKAGDIQIKAASIFLTKGAQLSASSHSLGAGGNITLVASDTVELTGETTSTPKGILNNYTNYSTNVVGLPLNTFLGGYIPNGTFQIPSAFPAKLELSSGTIFPSGVFSQATLGSTANAGNLKIETGKLTINNGAAIATTTFGKNSNAGDISIKARESIKINNGSILSGVAPGAIGNSGKVELSTPKVSITNSGIVQTQTLGEGFAGEIVVDADTLSIGKDSAFRATTATNSIGGDITVSANTLSVDKGGQILTSTSGTGDAGNIKVNATNIQLSDSQSGLLAQTSSAGKAGNLTIQPRNDEQTLRVFFQEGAQISASTSSSGKGGAITVKAPESITLTGDGSIISAETSGNGSGGDLSLNTGRLRVENNAQVSVNSKDSGSAGNLIVDANSIYLNNQGRISADTTGGGGNIFVNSPLLVLRRGSSITTNASGNNITGGDITIDGKNGFIVALPWENSDIRADSENFRGGNVTIKNTAGIYGIQPRKEPLPNSSDITATGATPNLSGNIQVNPPELDPNNGLVELPVNLVDASNQINTACTPGGSQFDHEFVVTGRGGLPMSPTEILQETNTLSSFLGEIRNK